MPLSQCCSASLSKRKLGNRLNSAISVNSENVSQRDWLTEFEMCKRLPTKYVAKTLFVSIVCFKRGLGIKRH